MSSIVNPAAGTTIGGTISGGTATRVLFEGTGPVLSDSASLTWNDTTKLFTVGIISPTTPGSIKIFGKDPTNISFGVGPYCTIDQSVTTGLMAPMSFTTFNPAAAGGEIGFIFNNTYSALGGFYLADFQQGGVSKFKISSDGSIAIASGATFTASTINSVFNQILVFVGAFGSSGNENQPVYQFKPNAASGHAGYIEFWDGNAIQAILRGADNTAGHANNLGINMAAPLAQIHAQTFEDTRKGLIIEGHSATQSGNLTEWQNSTPSVLASVNAKGRFTFITPTTTDPSFNCPAGTAPTSPTEGDTWNDSTQKASITYVDAIKQASTGTIFTQTADKTVTNTVTETSIVGTGIGTLTLPANFFVAGKTIRFRIGGIYSTPSLATPSVLIKVKYGSTVLASVTTSSLLSGATTLEFDGEILVTCRTIGGSGSVAIHGDIEYSTGVAGTIAVDSLNNVGATATIDTTASSLLDVTITWDSATSTRIVKSTISTCEVLN